MSDNEAPSTKPAPVKDLILNILIPSVYPLGLLIMWLAPMDFGFGIRSLVYLGLTVGLTGLALWIVAMVNLGQSLAVLPGSRQLVRRGIYQFVRHPIYLGISLTFAGLTLCLGSAWGLGYLIVVILPVNIIRALFETKALRVQFGEQYESWRASTWF